MRSAIDLTADELRHALDYDPETGIFTWRITRGGTARQGTKAGWLNRLGYVCISVGNFKHYAHRLAWLHTHGEWPAHEIDHVNGIPRDNRIANLRAATRRQNNLNKKRRRDCSSGVKGVTWIKRCSKWRADIRVNGKAKHLGYFTEIEDAASAYASAAVKHFGEFANMGDRS